MTLLLVGTLNWTGGDVGPDGGIVCDSRVISVSALFVCVELTVTLISLLVRFLTKVCSPR